MVWRATAPSTFTGILHCIRRHSCRRRRCGAAVVAAAARRAGYRAQRISVLVVRIPLLFFPQSALSLLSVTSSSFFAAMLTKSHLWSFYSSVFPRKPEKFVSISQLIRRHDNLLSRFTDLYLLIGDYFFYLEST